MTNTWKPKSYHQSVCKLVKLNHWQTNNKKSARSQLTVVHKSTVHTKCVAIGHCGSVVVVVVTKLATTIIAITIARERGERIHWWWW